MFYSDFGPVPAASSILHARVSLTSSQVLALNTSPPVLIPGINSQIIVPFSVNMTLNYNSTTYVTSNTLGVFYSGNTNAPILSASASFLTQTASASTTLRNALSVVPLAVSLGAAIILYLETGNATTGNSSVDVDVWYTLCAP